MHFLTAILILLIGYLLTRNRYLSNMVESVRMKQQDTGEAYEALYEEVLNLKIKLNEYEQKKEGNKTEKGSGQDS